MVLWWPAFIFFFNANQQDLAIQKHCDRFTDISGKWVHLEIEKKTSATNTVQNCCNFFLKICFYWRNFNTVFLLFKMFKVFHLILDATSCYWNKILQLRTISISRLLFVKIANKLIYSSSSNFTNHLPFNNLIQSLLLSENKAHQKMLHWFCFNWTHSKYFHFSRCYALLLRCMFSTTVQETYNKQNIHCLNVLSIFTQSSITRLLQWIHIYRKVLWN